MELSDLPRVLIASTVSGKAGDIARSIGSESSSRQSDVEYYIWNIDNKYYKARVLLCATDNPWTKISTSGVDALIVHHEPRAEDAARRLDEWTPVIDELSEADVLLFACDEIPDESTKEQVARWCSLRKFEFVQLEGRRADETLDAKEDDGARGIDRIVEALQAHAWPNMVLKGNPTSERTVDADVKVIGEHLDGVCLDAAHGASERLRAESVLDGIMGAENTDFGELFGQLVAMKEHAASLPANRRKIAAEQLVTAFWKAMGGDPEEIEESE